MAINYMTIQGEAIAEYEISRSRFIAYAKRISSDTEATAYIQAIKKKHWDARHNCASYVIGERGQLQKADDDGEPSGTAGKPILEVIKKNNLTDLVLVVTRYFGGIKLGAGGLIRAYGKAATMALTAATIVERRLFAKIQITIEYPLLGSVENNLHAQNYRIIAKDFTDCVTLTVLAETGSETTLTEDVTNWTAANSLIENLGFTYVEIPVNTALSEPLPNEF